PANEIMPSCATTLSISRMALACMYWVRRANFSAMFIFSPNFFNQSNGLSVRNSKVKWLYPYETNLSLQCFSKFDKIVDALWITHCTLIGGFLDITPQ